MIAMAGIAVIATACGGSSSSTSSAASASPSGPEKPDLVVAVVPAEAQAGLYIAQAKGLFAKAGLHVTIKPVVSALTVIPALLHGDVDVAGGQYPSYIATQAKGLAHMRVLAAGFALGPRVNEILAQVLATALHLSPKVTGVMATGTFPTSANPAQIQRVANLMLQYGQLKQPLNVKQMIEG